MAKIIGESGRTAEKQLLHAFRRMFIISLLGIGLMSLAVGYVVCLSFRDGLIPRWLAASARLGVPRRRRAAGSAAG